MSKFDVICVGTAIVDIPLYPVNPDILDQVSFPLEDISMKIGGDAINEATIIARLGNQVALISAVGNDSSGDFIVNSAKENDINVDHLKQSDDLTTSINIGLIHSDGERTFLNNRNGSLWKMSINDIDVDSIKDAKILSLASIFNNPLLNNRALVKIFRQAKSQGMIICADMVASRLHERLNDIAEALNYVDYFFPNYDEASMLTGLTDLDEIADKFMSLGVKHVVIKIGKKGAFIKSKNVRTIVPAFVNKGAIHIDTTGAGDNFAAGFISELVQDKSFEECARFASAVAAVSVEGLGATAGVKSKQQVNQMIANYSVKG